MKIEKKRAVNPPTTLIIGGFGFVGSYVLGKLSAERQMHYVAPKHSQLDITNEQSVLEVFSKIKPDFVINFAAITNMDESEKERGNKKGKTWKTNYIGVSNLVDNCRKYKAFLIHISTDAVFPGTDEYPGPYAELDAPSKNGKDLNWYGITKLKAEESIRTLKKNFAILRISHPFGDPSSKRDLVRKTIEDIRLGHNLFTDQLFTPTFLEDLSQAISAIQSKKISGIFHVGCRGLVARIEFDRYLAKQLRMKETLKVGSLTEFISTPHRALRTRIGGFITDDTQKRLEIRFHRWQEALEKTVSRI